MSSFTSSKIKRLVAHQNNSSSNSSTSLTVDDLEILFINKLSEKYSLTDREISKAFKKYDSDNSGYLSNAELSKAIHLYLNGVDEKLIKELVQRFDTDGDGEISIAEFTFRIINLVSNPESRINTRPTSTSISNTKDQDIHNVGSSMNKVCLENSNSIEHQIRSFLSNMKAILSKKAMELILSKKFNKYDRLGSHMQPLAESTSKDILLKDFHPYLHNKNYSVDFNSFKRVILKYTYPGAIPPHEIVLQSLFLVCCYDDVNSDVDITVSSIRCDPNLLIDLLFTNKRSISSSINKFGFYQSKLSATDLLRPEVGKGPLQPFNKLNQEPTRLQEIPHRILTKESHTSIAIPSDFHLNSLNYSKQLPSYNINRGVVTGLNMNTLSNPCMASHSKHGLIYSVGKMVVLQDTPLDSTHQTILDSSSSSSTSALAGNITCMALSPDGKLLATGTSVSLSRVRPCVRIWDLSSSSLPTSPQLILGQDQDQPFFTNGVCSIAFTCDNTYLAGINCDDKHSLGIFKLSSEQLVARVTTANGLPPQILAMKFAPILISTNYIHKDFNNLDKNDLFCTIGPSRHLKFWSFYRPQSPSRSNLRSKATETPVVYRSFNCSTLKIKLKHDICDTFTCIDYVFNHDKTDADVLTLTGGDNGVIYQWGQNNYRNSVKVFEKKVCCLFVVAASVGIRSAMLYCSGDSGGIAILEANSLNILKVINLFEHTNSNDPSNRAAAVSRSISGTSRRMFTKNDSIKSLGKVVEEAASDGIKGSRDVLNVAPVFAPAASETGSGVSIDGLVAVTGLGTIVHIDLYTYAHDIISYYHYGPLYAVVSKASSPSYVATGGDDRWLCLWNDRLSLLFRSRMKYAIRAIDVAAMDSRQSSLSVAVGMTNGYIAVYGYLRYSQKILDNKKPAGRSSELYNRDDVSRKECEFIELCPCRRDATKDISDVKFNPTATLLAVGSHDDCIYIYSHKFQPATIQDPASCKVSCIKRLRGHSSSIRHLDWSSDGLLLRSMCGAYELLFWDVAQGKQLLSSVDRLEADTSWNSSTCTIGFEVMGIWPKDANGQVVNAADVSQHLQLVVSGDDRDLVNVFNRPCVVKHAPSISLAGHGSFVTDVAFHSHQGSSNHNSIVSVGGDGAIILWLITENYEAALPSHRCRPLIFMKHL